ncbi:small, acid-soluble spore protein, alpha/beta type [Fictibacillus sp. NRS-1165]|uniref:small, acid-soluble spore protein, alpha/beta type n=1 Tax=Fictibacillus sp. NRS-1165 TaxID=3144463 RepID=UPI003D226E69
MLKNNNSRACGGKVDAIIVQISADCAGVFGVQLGADQTSRANGSVGGEITKRLVATAQQQLSGFGGQQQ